MLDGKITLVTGGAGDLGNEMALQLAQAGASVVIWDIKSEADARPRIERVKIAGNPVHYAQVDIRDRSAVEAATDDILSRFGSLDIVCANAGIVDSAPFLEISPEKWQRHIDINLTGSFNVGQVAAQRMVARKIKGRIIFTSVGWRTSPGRRSRPTPSLKRV